MAALLSQADPHLAALKSFALALMEKGRDQPRVYELGNKLDMARGKLYQSIRDGASPDATLAWLNAVELTVESAVAVIPDTERSACAAVAGLKKLIQPRRVT